MTNEFRPLTIEDLTPVGNKTKTEYRRATAEELASIGYIPNDEKYSAHIGFARKYYPSNATTMVLVVHSEYNDNTYDNSIKYVVVYDKDCNELPPLKDTAKECRSRWDRQYLPIPGTNDGSYSSCESQDFLEDVIIPLGTELPELYVKVN